MTGGVWRIDTVGWVIAAALLPALAVIATEQGVPGLARMALAGLAVVFWQLVFRIARGVAFSPAGAVTAVAVGALASGELAPWQILLAVSFGTVLGELVFGGWGRNFLSGAVLTLAFLYFSFGQVPHPESGTALALAMLPSAVLLIACGILPAPVPIAGAAAAWAVAAATGTTPMLLPALGALAFAGVFLAGDPVASAATRAGRWVYGALAGGLAALFLAGGTPAPQAVVFATLLASIFAPLIDQAAIHLSLRGRSAPHG